MNLFPSSQKVKHWGQSVWRFEHINSQSINTVTMNSNLHNVSIFEGTNFIEQSHTINELFK